MKKSLRLMGVVLAASLLATGFAGCQKKDKNAGSDSTAPDTVTALLPPISANYQKNFDSFEKDFQTKYLNLTLKIEPASWEDMTQKLDVQVNAGTPPDIAFIGSDGIPKYVDTGMLMDISKVATEEMVSDYDAGPLGYAKNGKGLYGFPAYMEVQSIGGNKQFLEAAGIDWKSIQKNGWTYDQFRQAIQKGVVTQNGQTSRYGFVFACSGVTSMDFLDILVKEAGMPSPFTKDLKFAYTSQSFLEVLKDIRQMIDDGSMPKSLNSIDAGKRWNMFLTGQTMITGKGMPTFENSANLNNKKIDAKDGSAVKDSIKADYVVLPAPTFLGNKQVTMPAVDCYVTFRGKTAPTAAHKANVVKAAYFLDSGKVMAETDSELYLPSITKSGREAEKSLTAAASRDPDNEAEVQRLVSQAAAARPDITSELGAKETKLETEVIVPKFQSLLAGEITPQQMYDAVKSAAVAAYGSNGVVKD